MVEGQEKERTLQTGLLTAEELAQVREAARIHTQQGQVSLLVYHRDRVEVVTLADGETLLIGREPPADVTIRDNSLSRQHARVELAGGEVWVEDLKSTNGTWVNGQKIDRCRVDAGAELTFGAVATTIRRLGPMENRQWGLQGHDCFQIQLEAEVKRAMTFGRSLALIMVKSLREQEMRLSHWLPRLRQNLRAFDSIGLYCCDIVEILLPEAKESEALEFANRVVDQVGPLVCGLAVLPDHARSPEELLSEARAALQRTSPGQRVSCVAPASIASGAGERPEDNRPVVVAPTLKTVFVTAQRLATSNIPVLLLGETGTGKEVVARAIHQGGKRRDHPMICVNCGGIPSQLIESTLFGHERGAFTDAREQTQGVFESADGGTVLLDEIGELPSAAQAALLRVLETKRFTRVGSNKEVEVDVRVLAATNRDLEAMCKAGSFREDLFYRLNGMTLFIPPLRERPEEVEPLVLHFIEQAGRANDRRLQGIAPDALDLLKRYPWPGNVRELRNAIERAAVIAQDERITVEDLPERVRGMSPPGGTRSRAEEPRSGVPGDNRSTTNLKQQMDRMEAELLLKALRENNWEREKAARCLGLALRTLAHKMAEHGIRRVSYEKDDKGPGG